MNAFAVASPQAGPLLRATAFPPIAMICFFMIRGSIH